MIDKSSIHSILLPKNVTNDESIQKLFYNLSICTFQTVFGYICLDICVAISLHYITEGIGPTVNAGYGFAFTCCSIIIVPFGLGLNQSLNMHTSQAIGDNKITLAKRFFNINLYVMLFSVIPLSILLLALKYPLSLTINEDEREVTSNYCQEFLYYLLPAMLLALEFESTKVFMIAHKIAYPFTFIHFVTLGIHWLTSWLFIIKFNWGIPGAGIAMILTEILNILGIILFILFTDIKTKVFKGTQVLLDWPKFKKLAPQYIKTSFPIVMHIMAEFFVFFLLSFIALSLSTAQMNAHLALQSISGIFFRIPVSLSIALMAFVGTEMGIGNVHKVKQYIVVGIIIFILSCTVTSAFIWFFRNAIAKFYCPESGENDIEKEQSKEAQRLFLETVPWLISGIVCIDGLQGTLSGALKGINKVHLVFYSTIIAYYILCIPLVSYFAYDWGLGNGVKGIWQGFGVSNIILAFLDIVVLLKADLDKESLKIINRIKYENELQQSHHRVEDIE